MDKDELDQRATIIVGQCGGIHPPYEAFYIHSIIYSASRTSESFQRFEIARSLRDSEVNQVSAVHEALGHAAALSRFFWPSGIGGGSSAIRQLRSERASKLRVAFELNDDSPLRDRHLRDALEHFDERLDLYLLEHDAGTFFPSARIGDVELADDPVGHIFKLLDPVKTYFVCMGQAFYYGELHKEVSRVHDDAVWMDENGCRLRNRTTGGA